MRHLNPFKWIEKCVGWIWTFYKIPSCRWNYHWSHVTRIHCQINPIICPFIWNCNILPWEEINNELIYIRSCDETWISKGETLCPYSYNSIIGIQIWHNLYVNSSGNLVNLAQFYFNCRCIVLNAISTKYSIVYSCLGR